ncbi:unnamed protein product [Darwinula stevensoni]|uniref:Insulin-degrading enzyme n=1 Tax=Darwinula stevensoni TaxID=69355 RepID=A0A7R9A0R2_9CRUS|nr:unnamed protein product [Darwinula stevensoni]CAG0881776.1 unnamed protein product [Darwinula stevensoni]
MGSMFKLIHRWNLLHPSKYLHCSRIFHTSVSVTMAVKQRFNEIIKSEQDDRFYRGLELQNGMKVILISDPKTDKAAGSLDVHVGHLSDPDDIEGLAHFCEHMLFLGTKKYPTENSYSKFLSEHGGSSNAFTSAADTNYHFDVAPPYLFEALDRFAQFFIHPLFTESATEREVNAVHSEHSKNIPSDSWRIDRVSKVTSDPQHAYCKFGTESLEELEERVAELFSDVKNKDIQAPEWLDHPYKEPQLRKVLEVLPVKDIRKLTLIFPIPDYKQFYRSAPEHYLSHLIGHEGPGSILSLLKEKGWVNTLVAGKYAGAPGFAFFQVNVDLTEDGLEHTEEIAEIIFQYLKLLHVSGPQEWIFEECRNLSSIDFRFKDKENPINYVVQVTLSLREYPIDEVLSGPYLFDQFKPELISEVLGLLIPDRVRLTVIAKKFEGTTVHKEEWYGIEYSISDIYPEVIKKWAHLNMHTELALPPKNEFIPTNFVLHPLPKDAKKTPQLIENSPLFRVWYKQDDRYFRPKAILKFQFVSPLAYLDPTHCNMNNLLVWLFRDALNEYAHSAQVAGLNYSLDCSKYGLQLTIYGFNDFLEILASNFLKFRLVGYVVRNYYLSQLMTDRSWSMEDLLQALPQITVHSLENFVNSFLSHLHVECLIHGNLTQKQAEGFINVVRSYLMEKGSARTHPLFPGQVIQDREVQLFDGDNFLYSQPHEVHESSCVKIYLQCLVEDTHFNMLVELFCQIIHEPCFDILRTKEQLGYMVFSGVRRSNGVQGVTVTVQSLYAPEHLNTRIEAFFDHIQEYLAEMKEEDFEKHKEALHSRILEKPKKMKGESSKLWAEITSKNYHFNRDEMEAEHLRSLTKEDIMNFYKDFIHNGSEKRHKLAIYVQSKVKPKDLLLSPEHHTPSLKPAKAVVDIVEFKRRRGLYPQAKSYLDVPVIGGGLSKL